MKKFLLLSLLMPGLLLAEAEHCMDTPEPKENSTYLTEWGFDFLRLSGIKETGNRDWVKDIMENDGELCTNFLRLHVLTNSPIFPKNPDGSLNLSHGPLDYRGPEVLQGYSDPHCQDQFSLKI